MCEACDTPETTKPEIELGTFACRIAVEDWRGDKKPAEVEQEGFYFHLPDLTDPEDENVMIYGPHATLEEANEAAIDLLRDTFGDVAAKAVGVVDADFVEESEA